MANVFDVILLLALPASGKSETRKFLSSHDEATIRNTFHFGTPLAQLDDFPYVHMMRRIDMELKKIGHEYVFFHAPDRSFKDPVTWGVLTLLLDQDYALVAKHGAPSTESLAELLKRFDAARQKLHAPPLFYEGEKAIVADDVLATLSEVLEIEYRQIQEERINDIPRHLENSTLIIEFARGGPDGARMPIPYGYEYNLRLLSPELLSKSAILYVWVTPEESRRKNCEREDPNDPGSILAHCVPMEVMLNDYGCDDIDYLIGKSDREGFIKVERAEGAFYIPIERFDNRVDKTSFVRGHVWPQNAQELLFDQLKQNLSRLYEKYKAHLKV